ncbi:signal transduction histidine kinase [Streptohalobacillus salinus]|uniref:histidine kinase n=1 Tax=Streptohalobacillus salinus TaxID=621096 RepID=A0A2V3W0D5_9BACI|nr:sensor histidine kinase [Streptohalobacillus salinus]PXW87360.1 signal transduction histidine kinase [Streptohalobacillus salinus]
MAIFFREHLGFVCFQLLQHVTLSSLLLLAGFDNTGVLLYINLLLLVFFTAFIVYRYFSRKQLYHQLSVPLKQLEEVLEPTGFTPLALSINQLLVSQYRIYQAEIADLETQQMEHLLFIDRWVHQMKTPLSVLTLAAEELDEPESSSIREEVDRMRQGLSTVLYSARLRTIEEDFQIESVNLIAMVHAVNKEHRRYYIRHRIYPKLTADKQAFKVTTDKKWLFFILSQLILNAVKYSANHHDTIEINIEEQHHEVHLRVRDYGVGIPVSDQKRVFDKFFTGENGRIFKESTGMGLYLVKEVAERLEHGVRLTSEVGKGTMVTLIFSETQNLTQV